MNDRKQKTYIKLTYPDGDIEFWSLDSDVKELERLQKLHNNNIKIEKLSFCIFLNLSFKRINLKYN